VAKRRVALAALIAGLPVDVEIAQSRDLVRAG
jgi:hypothetical protein